MKFFSFILLFLIPSIGHCVETSVANQVSEILARDCKDQKINQIDKELPIQIAYFRGSPVDAMNDGEAGDNFLASTAEVLKNQGFKVSTMAVHHLNWEKVCQQFKENPKSRVVLVGHSYGTSGAMKTVHCLKEAGIKTEELISVSSFNFMAGVDPTSIPESVASHTNFWVVDPLIPGYSNHVAENPQKTTVKNIRATVRSISPHLFAPRKLHGLLTLETAAKITGKEASIEMKPSIYDKDVENNLSKFYVCEEVPQLGKTENSEARTAISNNSTR